MQCNLELSFWAISVCKHNIRIDERQSAGFVGLKENDTVMQIPMTNLWKIKSFDMMYFAVSLSLSLAPLLSHFTRWSETQCKHRKTEEEEKKKRKTVYEIQVTISFIMRHANCLASKQKHRFACYIRLYVSASSANGKQKCKTKSNTMNVLCVCLFLNRLFHLHRKLT